jgi:hypothetical protein
MPGGIRLTRGLQRQLDASALSAAWGSYIVKRWTIRTLGVLVPAAALLALPATASAANNNNGTVSAIVAGNLNTIDASEYGSIIGAGGSNALGPSTNVGQFNGILSGQNNTISSENFSVANFIGGGSSNSIKSATGAGTTVQNDVIAGGDTNTITGSWSSIPGGYDNTVGNDDSAVLGGLFNVVNGKKSLAGGQQSDAEADNSIALGTDATVPSGDTGSVVLADGEGAGAFYVPCSATTTNQLVLCFNTVRIVLARDNTGNPTTWCDISSTGVTGTGCPLAQSPTIIVDALRTQQREHQLEKRVTTQAKQLGTLQREVQTLLKRTSGK